LRGFSRYYFLRRNPGAGTFADEQLPIVTWQILGLDPTVRIDPPFTVPPDDCPAQRVKLVFNARYASERFISGSIWYDQLEIVKEDKNAS
jgi:hypothetical protein